MFFFRVWGRGWREDFFGIGVLFPYMFFESYSHFQNVPNTFPMFFMYPFLLHMICRLLFPFVIPNIPMQTPWWSQITPHFIPYSLPKILLLYSIHTRAKPKGPIILVWVCPRMSKSLKPLLGGGVGLGFRV